MEQDTVPTANLPSATMAPVRQLPPGGNKLNRITQHTKGLFDDITSWVELRIKLTQIEIEEKVEAKVNNLVNKALVAALALLGGLFALITTALGLAAIGIAIGLSHPLSYFLGFLLVTLTLLAVAAILKARRPELVHMDKQARVEEERLVKAADLA